MKPTFGRILAGALSLALVAGCGGKKDAPAPETKEDTTQNATSRPANPRPNKAAQKEPPKPEGRVGQFSGTVEYQKASGPWAPVTEATTLDTKDSLRVGADGSATLLLPDDSTVEIGPGSFIHLAENERRELALAYGFVAVKMKDKSTDRAGIQIRTPSALIRGPQAAFAVASSVSGDTMLAVERGVVYAGDEKQDLATQMVQAQEALDAAAAGKELPKPDKAQNPYTKIDPGAAATFTAGAPLQLVPNGQDTSPAAAKRFLDENAGSLSATSEKVVLGLFSAIESDLATAEGDLEKSKLLKDNNTKLIEDLKLARAAKDQPKQTAIQSDIARNSRLMLSVKRQAHALALDAFLRGQLLRQLALRPEGDPFKAAAAAREADLVAVEGKVAALREKTNGLRPRPKISTAGAVNRPANIKLPAGAMPGGAPLAPNRLPSLPGGVVPAPSQEGAQATPQ